MHQAVFLGADFKLQDSKDMVPRNACVHNLSCQVSMLVTGLVSPIETALRICGLAHLMQYVAPAAHKKNLVVLAQAIPCVDCKYHVLIITKP